MIFVQALARASLTLNSNTPAHKHPNTPSLLPSLSAMQSIAHPFTKKAPAEPELFYVDPLLLHHSGVISEDDAGLPSTRKARSG